MAGVSTEELKSRVSIVDIVSNYVSLRKAGRSHTGLCPFHDDKNPSLHVSDEKRMFYCFSCKAGGDVFAFLQRIKGCDFKEALQEVADKAGVSIERFAGSKNSNDEFFTINKAVCDFFRKSLQNGTEESEKALSYLRQRGIDSEIIEQFSIGYAPALGSAVPSLLSKLDLSLRRAKELGLVDSKEGSSDFYCKFRSRVMFSIFSPDSKIIGFGGRIIDENTRAPKYLNSAESPVYRKRRSLYGLNKTRQEIRKQGVAVLVEGYTDFLSVYAGGVKNVAASLGTSLTREQVGIFKGYADDIVILYDGDHAGMDASFSAGEVFMAGGVVPRVARVPEGLDPDGFVKNNGIDALRALIDGALPLTEVLMEDMSSALAEKRVSQSVAAKKLMAIVPILGDSPEVGPYVREVSCRFGFREADLYSLASSAGKPRSQVRDLPAGPSAPEVVPAEMMLLRIALKFPEMAEFLCAEEIMKHIPPGETRDIISSIRASGMAGSEHVSEGSGGLLSRAYFTLEEISFMDESNVRREVEKCLVKLKLDAIGRELKSVRESLRVLETDSHDDTRGGELMKRYRDLLDERKKLTQGDLS
ncbi:MAG: DNA primase [Candidatus Mycalebacterium zealandia]|nr:MAG: DNA primase [Candidatus Mycalebacterium zealandia]